MTPPPKIYIDDRRRELTKQIEALNAELRVLDAMASVLDESLRGAAPVPALKFISPHAETALPLRAKRRHIEGGIKARVMAVLVPYQGAKGMTAREIQVALNVFYGLMIARTSLSPQLSRLRREGMVEVEDAVWFATDKGREAYPNEA